MSARAEELNYLQPYIASIQTIRDKITGIDYTDKKRTIEKISSTFSNTKQPIYKLVLDEKPISRNNNLIVGYCCQTCGTCQEITLTLFMRKVNKGTKRCAACVNQDDKKCQTHSLS